MIRSFSLLVALLAILLQRSAMRMYTRSEDWLKAGFVPQSLARTTSTLTSSPSALLAESGSQVKTEFFAFCTVDTFVVTARTQVMLLLIFDSSGHKYWISRPTLKHNIKVCLWPLVFSSFRNEKKIQRFSTWIIYCRCKIIHWDHANSL